MAAPRTVAERYQLDSILGHGGMGDVWLGHDQRLGRDVAVKFLRPDLAADPELRGRFEHEARAAARLTHPNIVAVFDSGEDGGEPFIIMERLPGHTVADEVRRGPLDIGRVERWAAEALSALSAAHTAGILHRDIKPSNLLLTATDSIKIADFGIAKAAEGNDATATGMVLGTAAYLAPERVTGQPATPASDQYALGVVLYEVLTGQCPFQGDNPLAVMHAVHAGQATPIRELRPDVPVALAALVERAMAPDPVQRYPTIDAMHAALTASSSDPLPPTAAITVPADHFPTTAFAASPVTFDPPLPSPHVRARRLPLAWVAALAVLVVLGIALLANRDSGNLNPTTTTTTTAQTTPTTAPTTAPVTTAPETTVAPPTGKPGKGHN